MTEPNPDSTRPSSGNILGSLAVGLLVVGLSAFAARALRGRVEERPPVAPPEVAVPARTPTPTTEPSGLAKRGRLIYQLQCARCHGPEGHGDGPDSANVRPSPRDFASDRWRFGSSPEAIRKVIVEGIAGTAMYPLGGSLSPREIEAVVEHVRSLAPKVDGPKLEARPTRDLEPTLKAAGFEPESPHRPAHSIAVEDLEGAGRTLEFGRGDRLTLLVFWGTTCAPCLEEMPELERLAQDFHDQGLAVIPVCVDESDRSTVRRVVRGKFDRFPSFVSVDGIARLRYDIQTLPVTALIDQQGSLIGIARGGINWRGEPARRLIAEGLADSP